MSERSPASGGWQRLLGPAIKGLEIGIALVAVLVWLATGEICPLLIGLSVVVTGPAEPFLTRLPWWPQSDGAEAYASRQGVRLLALLLLLGAVLA